MEQKTHKQLYSTHAWVGIISGILLFVVTFSGIPAMFDHEIEYWQYPVYSQVGNHEANSAQTGIHKSGKQPFDLEKALLAAQKINFDHDDYFIQPASDINNHVILAHFEKGKDSDLRYLDANQYEEFPSSPSELNHLLSHLHTDLHIPNPWGRYLVGLSGMAMLLAIIAGIFIHVKWRKEFVMLRPKRSWRLLLTDQHKLLGLWSLPFTFILAFTGTILGLLGLISPILALAAFNGDVEKATIAVLGPKAELTSEYSPVYPANKLLNQLDIDFPNGSIDFIQVSGLKIQENKLITDTGGLIKFSGYHNEKLSNLESVTYSLSTGEKVHQGSFVEKGPFQRIFAAVTPLHYVLFGNAWLKVFYALSALAACGLILTGNMLWLHRRGHSMEHWLSKLTLGICGGLVVSTSISFLTSQTLYAFELSPASHLHHKIEEWVFWASWGLVILMPFVYHNAFKLSHYLLRLTSLSLLATLLADGMVNQRWIGFTEGWVLNIQLGILFSALLFIYLDRKMPKNITEKSSVKNSANIQMT